MTPAQILLAILVVEALLLLLLVWLILGLNRALEGLQVEAKVVENRLEEIRREVAGMKEAVREVAGMVAGLQILPTHRTSQGDHHIGVTDIMGTGGTTPTTGVSTIAMEGVIGGTKK